MATISELESALIKAHNAGDSDAARLLTREIDVARRHQALYRGGGAPALSSFVTGEVGPTPAERFSRGVWDGGQALKQRYLMLTDPDKSREYTAEISEEEKRYQEGRGKDAGFDVMRLGGNILAGAPIAAAVAAAAPASMTAAGASLAARMALGAIQGGAQGAMTFSPEGTWGNVAKQTAIGTVAGATGPVIAAIGSNLAARGVESGRTLLNKANATPEKIMEAVEPVLAERGIRWGDLSSQVREGFLAQARRQLSIEGELTPDALVRKLEMEEVLGRVAGPTRAQVTRDPMQWSWERNTSKLQDVGNPLVERYQAQIQRLRDVANQAIERVGGRARNDFQAGSSATEAVKSKMDDSKAVVDKLYDTWRSSGSGGTTVKPQAIADELGRVLEEIGEENNPAAVQNRLKVFGMLGGKQTKLLTIDEAEKLRKLIGNNDPGHGPQALASGRLKRAVDEAVLETDAPDIPTLQEARKAAHARFAMRDSAPGVTAAAKDEAPDRFFQRFVLNGNVRDIQGLKQTLTSGFLDAEAAPQGVQAWKDLKGRVLEHLVEKATGLKDGTFSGPALRKAMKEIGDERLKVIFDPGELEQLKKLDRVAVGLTSEPNLAAVNHSNTAATGAQYLRDAGRIMPALAEKATGIPFVGKMAAGMWSAGDQVARNADMKRRVSEALLGNASDPGAVAQRRRALAHLISSYASPVASVGGAAGALYGTNADWSLK